MLDIATTNSSELVREGWVDCPCVTILFYFACILGVVSYLVTNSAIFRSTRYY